MAELSGTWLVPGDTGPAGCPVPRALTKEYDTLRLQPPGVSRCARGQLLGREGCSHLAADPVLRLPDASLVSGLRGSKPGLASKEPVHS